MDRCKPRPAAQWLCVAAGCVAAGMPVGVTAADGTGARTAAGAQDAGTAESRTDPPPSARQFRAVFVCRDAVPVIFADRPCGQFAETLGLHYSAPGPGLASTTIRPPAPAATRPRVEPHADDAATRAKDASCRRLKEQRARIDDHMREGYSAREAGELWRRWREIDARLYAERCRP